MLNRIFKIVYLNGKFGLLNLNEGLEMDLQSIMTDFDGVTKLTIKYDDNSYHIVITDNNCDSVVIFHELENY